MKKTITKMIYGLGTFLTVIVIIYLIFFWNKEQKRIEIIETSKIEETRENLNLGIVQFDTINPINSKNKHVQYLDKIIYESLVEVDEEFKLTNLLAKEISKINETSYIVVLRDNVYFQNGEKLTTSHIEQTIYEIQKNEMSIYMNNVKNIATTNIIDEQTIRINLKEPEDFFEYNLIFPIINKEENIGTGKYIIKTVEDYILLEYNENHWRNKTANFKTITIYLYEDFNELYTAFKKEEIDLFCTNQQDYIEFLGTKVYSKKEYQGREFNYLILNLNNEILNKKEVRQALTYAIDKQNIIDSIYKSHYICNYPFSEQNWLYFSKNTSEYNQDKAIEILEQASWEYNNKKWTKNKKELTFNFTIKNTSEKQRELAIILQKKLKEIGINMQITEVQSEFYDEYLENGNYEIILIGRQIGLVPNLDYYFQKNNLSNYENEQVQLLLTQTKETKEERYLLEIYEKIEEYFIKDIPFIPLNFSRDTLIYNNKLRGNIEPNWYNIFYNIESWKLLKN